ncbi:hypothetical protein GCM10028806_26940 [Spirosoma terrae]
MTFTGTTQGSVTASKTASLGTSKPMALVYDGQYTYPSRSICGPTSLSLVAYPDEAYSGNQATYFWTGPNGFTSTERNPVVSQGATGLYILEATYPNNCGVGRDTVRIYDTSLFVYTSASSIGPNPQIVGSICLGESIAIQAITSLPTGTSATYQWSGPNGFTSTAQSFTLANATTSMQGSYTVTATFSGNCTGTATATQLINVGSPSLFAYSSEPNSSGGSSVNTFCPGSGFRVAVSSGGAPTSYQWSGPNGFTSQASSVTFTNATSAMTGAYSVTATFSGGCSNTATAQVTIGLPTASITAYAAETNSPGSSFCPGTAIRMEAFTLNSTNATYQWSGPNGFTSSTKSFTLTSVTPAMAGIYSVTVTLSGSCTSPIIASQTISVGTPSLFVYSTDITGLSGNSFNTYCPGSSFRLVASSSAAGISYQWSGPNGFTSQASSVTFTNATSAMTGTYSVTATFPGGCSNIATAQVTIGNATVAIGSYNLENNQPALAFCPGNTVRMAILSSPPPSTSYQWRGPNGFTSNAESFTLTNVIPSMAGTYSVTATTPTGCLATGSRTIAIGPPSVFISSGTYACEGGQLSLEASPTINYTIINVYATYQWSGPNGFTSSAKSFTLTNVTPASAGLYSVTATFSGGCSGTVTASKQIRLRKPSLSVFSQSTDQSIRGESYCPGTSFEVYPLFFQNPTDFPSNRSAVSYQWSGPNGFTSTEQKPTIPTATSLASGLYSLTATATGECSGVYTATREINVGSPFSYVSASPISGIAQNETYCPGASVRIAASNNPANANVVSYQWRGPNGFTSSASSFTLDHVSAATAGVYSLTTIYGGNCAGKRVSFANIKAETPPVYIGVYPVIGGGSGGPTNPPPLCQGNGYTLSPSWSPYNTDSLGLNTTYEWTLPDGSVSNATSLSITNASQANAGRYILTTTLGGVCASGISRDTVDLVVGIPAPRVWSSNLFITNGGSTTLFADECAGPTVRWSDGQTGRSIVVSPAQTTLYTATCENSEGCLSPPSASLTVRVSNQPEADLSLHIAVSNRTPVLGQPVSVTLSVKNASKQEARNIQLESRLPNFLAVVDGGNFQNNSGVLTTTLSSIPASGSVNQTIQLVATSEGVFRLSAQIMASDNPDPDSYPGSGTNDGQDDMSWVDLRTTKSGMLINTSPEPNPAVLPNPTTEKIVLPFDKVDLSLNLSASNVAPTLNEVITITVQLGNYDDRRLLSPEVTCQLPSGLTFVSGTNFVADGQTIVLTGGRYYECWPQSFSFQARVTGAVDEPVKARITYCDWEDVDSDPGNGFDTGEDDTAQISLRVR